MTGYAEDYEGKNWHYFGAFVTTVKRTHNTVEESGKFRGGGVNVGLVS